MDCILSNRSTGSMSLRLVFSFRVHAGLSDALRPEMNALGAPQQVDCTIETPGVRLDDEGDRSAPCNWITIICTWTE